MKKKLIFALGMILAIGLISAVPSQAVVFESFNPISSGDEIHWQVLVYNESNNIYEPTEWTDENYAHKGNYILTIGQEIIFTVTNVTACTGVLIIGNLTITTNRHELGVNLLTITGPAWPPFSNYSFDPALISPTNWQTQIELANNATNERTFPSAASIVIGTSYKTFLGVNRSVISFNFTWGDQTSKTIYDNETGVLLYMDCKFQLWWLEMVITIPSGIPSFELPLGLLVITGMVVIIFWKRRVPVLNKNTS